MSVLGFAFSNIDIYIALREVASRGLRQRRAERSMKNTKMPVAWFEYELFRLFACVDGFDTARQESRMKALGPVRARTDSQREAEAIALRKQKSPI